ncbi:MAG: zinc-binding dehydrogenase [Actinophytocola sp.]|uniref:quinone oxidoreductase family protein n=1 Tax=Actinophytocola sp. TaxID=1872138 RepID=UPI001323F6F4|nr:zinc-binding dehydrogenase [Actinophytocola sp.]MPZ79552.1 zinc-binding dehydrogenase [Actinophytocola sp.]
MKAARLHEFGSPLRIDDVPAPAPGPDEVLVRLTHAGVNPIDIRLRDGGAGRVELPFVPGCDGVGRADSGPVVVYGAGLGLRRAGTYAEQVAVPAKGVVRLPDGVDPVQAAGIGLAGVTAWALVGRGVTAADRVLVLGASGGVGSLAVQLARSAGARVWAQTTDPEDASRLDLGADRVVACDAAGLRDAVRELEPTVVLDGLGGAFTGAAVRAVANGGRITVFGVSAGARGEVDYATLYRKSVTLYGHASLAMPAADVRDALVGCLELVGAGQVRVLVDEVLPLGAVNAAHRRLTERRTTGKLVLAV